MGKLMEYIKLLPAGIANIDKVIEGYRNNLKLENNTLNEEDAEVIIGRRLICSTCPFNNRNATRLGFYFSSREDEHCIQCGCPIKTKTASLTSNCGIETYNLNNPDKPLSLKWEKVKDETQ